MTDDQVHAQLNELREQQAPWAPVAEREAQPKDLVHVTIAQREGDVAKEPAALPAGVG